MSLRDALDKAAGATAMPPQQLTMEETSLPESERAVQSEICDVASESAIGGEICQPGSSLMLGEGK